MNGDGMRSNPKLAAILASCVCLAMPASGQPIAVGVDASTVRVLPPNFYGATGDTRGDLAWDQIDPSTGKPYNPDFGPALGHMQYGILRFPTGTGSDFWDWRTGQSVTNYKLPKRVETPPAQYPSPPGELKRELASAGQFGARTRGDFVLNLLTDPLCAVPQAASPPAYCTYSPTSPDLQFQLRLLGALTAQDIDVGYLELGNELYGGGTTSDYVKVYPTAEDYVKTVNSWIKAIKRLYPDIKIAAVAVNRAIELERHVHDEREDTWNKALMSALVGADAVVLHNYPAARLPTHTFVTDDNAGTMLQEPLINWDQIVADDLPELINKTTGYTPDIWFTEYNLKEDSDVQAEGSWAQGLYVATLSLLYATNSRVQMAVNYNVYDGMYADIFAVSDLFQLRDKLNITATVNGYTAKGLTTREVDAAAMGKTCAAALTFPGGPTFDGTHPKLIGEVFSGDESGTSTAPATPDKRCSASSLPSLLAKSDSQIIILNLDSVAHAVRFGDLLSRGAYQQIHGSAGSYVDGKVLPHGFEGFASDLSHADLTLTAEVLNPRYLWLAPFSITRVVTGADAPSPGSGDLPQ